MKGTHPDSTPDEQLSGIGNGSRQLISGAYSRDVVKSESANHIWLTNEILIADTGRTPTVSCTFCLASKSTTVVVAARPNLRIYRLEHSRGNYTEDVLTFPSLSRNRVYIPPAATDLIRLG